MKKLTMAALPIVLSQLIGQLMAMSDIWMMSKISIEVIASGGLAASVFSFFYVISKAMVNPTTNLLSIQFGKDSQMSTPAGNVQQILLSGLIMSCILAPIMWLLLSFIDMFFRFFGQAPNIVIQAMEYLFAVKWSLLPLLALIVIQSLPIAYGKTATVLLSTIVLVISNIVISYLLAFPLGLGLAGLGWGTTIAAALTLMVYFYWIFRRPEFKRYQPRQYNAVVNFKHLKQLVRFGSNSALAMLAESGLIFGAALIAGTLGTIYLAIHQIVLQLLTFSWNVAFGFAQATAMRVGVLHGAGRDIQEIRNTALHGFTLVTLVTFAIGFYFVLYPDVLIGLFVSADDKFAEQFIEILPRAILVAACCFVVDGWQVLVLNVLRSVQIIFYPTLIAVFGYCIIGIPTALYLKTPLQLNGIWIGIGVGLGTTAILLLAMLIRFFKETPLQGAPR